MKPPDPKVIAESLGGDSESPMEGGDEYTPESDLESAVADFCDACDSKDYKAAAAAIKQVVMLVNDDKGAAPADDMESGESLTK